MPVSYTHLDVYKGQGQGQVLRVTNTILGRMQTDTTCHVCSG